jgi:hypothetical protein
MTRKNHAKCLKLLVLSAALVSPAVPAAAGSADNQLSYSAFRAELGSATALEYLGHSGVKVESAAEFEVMRNYLETYYTDINPTQSFRVGEQIVDCVPISEQPSLRHSASIAAPPPPDIDEGPSPGVIEASPNARGTTDDGRDVACVRGTIPMRRLTLEELVRFKTLRDFFRKEPGDSAIHGYAHAYQNVDNWGGNAALNLWKTSVNQNQGEDTSIAQHWYVGGSGSQLQTAETGWINYPGMFGSDPVLFIYWTADAYNSTGCYNLDCTAFVQVNSSWCLGCKFEHYSETQGKQYAIELGYYLYQGNWWLKVGWNPWRNHESEWLGYYPASIYNGGQMSQNAQVIDYGGEVAVNKDATSWPCMGSCHFADDGYRSAAFVRRITYRGDTSNTHYIPSLTTAETNPACYTITEPAFKGNHWQTYFFFGGPGNTSC